MGAGRRDRRRGSAAGSANRCSRSPGSPTSCARATSPRAPRSTGTEETEELARALNGLADRTSELLVAERAAVADLSPPAAHAGDRAAAGRRGGRRPRARTAAGRAHRRAPAQHRRDRARGPPAGAHRPARGLRRRRWWSATGSAFWQALAEDQGRAVTVSRPRRGRCGCRWRPTTWPTWSTSWSTTSSRTRPSRPASRSGWRPADGKAHLVVTDAGPGPERGPPRPRRARPGSASTSPGVRRSACGGSLTFGRGRRRRDVGRGDAAAACAADRTSVVAAGPRRVLVSPSCWSSRVVVAGVACRCRRHRRRRRAGVVVVVTVVVPVRRRRRAGCRRCLDGRARRARARGGGGRGRGGEPRRARAPTTVRTTSVTQRLPSSFAGGLQGANRAFRRCRPGLLAGRLEHDRLAWSRAWALPAGTRHLVGHGAAEDPGDHRGQHEDDGLDVHAPSVRCADVMGAASEP